MSITYTSVVPRGIGRKDYSQAAEQYAIQPELLLEEGFEFLPRSFDTGGSVNSFAIRDTTNAWRGGGCLGMNTGNVADNFVWYMQRFGIVQTRKMLLDVSFAFTATPGLGVSFRIGRYTGSQLEYGDAIYDIGNARWDIHSGPITGGGQTLFQDFHTFHRILLAIDFDLDEYLYMRCNDLELDLSSMPIFTQNSNIAPYAFVRVYFWSGAIATQLHYIDNVRVSELT